MTQFARRRFLAGASLRAWAAANMILAALPAAASPPVVGALLLDQTAGSLFRESLKRTGHQEGKSVILELRYAEGDNARYSALARELMLRSPRVVFAPCGEALRAIREIDRTVPVVSGCFDLNNYLGEVKSLRRPGGATTGFTFLNPESVGKRLELLLEVRPPLSRVAVLHNKVDDWGTYWHEIERAASGLGLSLVRLPSFSSVENVDAALAYAARQRCEALIVFLDATLINDPGQITALAVRYRLLTAFDFAGLAEAGGLLSYHADRHELVDHGARYVDRILRGESPAEMPIVQPTKFELVVNLRTAKALGIAIPRSLLLRADRVIE